MLTVYKLALHARPWATLVTVIVRPHRSATRVQVRMEDTCCSVLVSGFATYDSSNGKTG